MEGALAANARAIRDSEEPLLPSNNPEIEAACILLSSEDLETDRSGDLMEVIHSCLKEIKPLMQHNYGHAMKMLTQLITVSKYVELHAD